MVNLSDNNVVFGLDIGTRSVVGTVGMKINAKQFLVEAMCVVEHDTRAMIDGQIHDVYMVTQTVAKVKNELEQRTGFKLDKVCIAAAGRVLKTKKVIADITFTTEHVVGDDDVYSLELEAVSNAYQELSKEIESDDIRFYCVGYSAVNYYLNGYTIQKLQGHRANKISVELLATFLPEEVIEGLYSAVEGAGLTVENLTLEPIAAINVAIPEQFRLLNIALVDVGAGTSDICITKDGSITAYGMIPYAGDELTEAIAHRYLVEFNEAERIKVESTKKKMVTFTDIMGIKNKIAGEQIQSDILSDCTMISKSIADKIKELNGGKSVSAVFVVGGGGKYPGFIESLAAELGLPQERVALRGEEVLKNVLIHQEGIKKDPLLVTPLGICLNYYERRNTFVSVKVNGQNIKIFDNSSLTVADAALSAGIKNEELFPRCGKNVSFTVNGEKRTVKGSFGEPSKVVLNGEITSITASVKNDDVIQIERSKVGEAAIVKISKLKEYNEKYSIYVDDRKVVIPRLVQVNGEYADSDYVIKDEDDIEITNDLSLEQVIELAGLNPNDEYSDGDKVLSADDKVKSGDSIYTIAYEKEAAVIDENNVDTVIHENSADTKVDKNNGDITDERISNTSYVYSNNAADVKGNKNTASKKDNSIFVSVNGSVVKLTGKDKYIFVDILDVYDFDLSKMGGNRLVQKVNDMPADFTTPLKDGDITGLYWED